ncbi:MAG: T9SS type A sorting domain-containing protein [Lewinellaceae bacterium]|nr:T9SS type A sorting domain-containing protein [Phaeodactylibacter sp.]MCB0612807.1 T9SS type A sorting domain-containing protein [Phaeodactylibacter sp.]MCB9347231.1 T9SS type A sorting domain-containing protein [Lewinellaceae bacterium]
MKWSSTLWALLFTLLLTPPLMSQTSCEYVLTMIDDFGDGWNGATLTITIGNNATVYTLNNIDDDGESASVSIPVTEGASIELFYISGSFPGEVEYTFSDAEGNILFQDGQMGGEPADGQVFSAVATCPSCPPPLAGSVEVENIRAFMVDISWIPSDPEGEYLIEYDTSGFTPGNGDFKMASGATTKLFSLQQNTGYDFYLTALCANGDTSVTVGPYSFMTPFANDVAITEILSPVTACGLGAAETISVAISNLGGVPQSLIPFDYSVNGIPGGVSMPQDGFFTGVIGTDSTEITEFDATFDFSDFGEYIVQVWTALEGDSIPSNDTTSITVVNIPYITEYPYFEGFEEWSGGWTVESDGFGAPSWAYGEPAGTLINNAANGSGAWVTNLGGNYNNSEISYLVSPCLDFSSLSEDPRIAFSIILNTENNFDEAWLEVSTNNGETWSKVGTAGTGLNWYNDAGNNWWENDGGVPGWHYAQNILEGTADSANVRVRFVFSSDGSVAREGVGLDNILISLQLDRDIAGSSADIMSASSCGSPNDTVSISLLNLGGFPAGGFDVGYSVNGGAPVVENIGNVLLLPGDGLTYTFNTTFDASVPGTYTIQAWSEFGTDEFLLNDTVTTSFRTSVNPPLREDFEDGGAPAGWAFSPGMTIEQDHTSPSIVAYDNVYSSTPEIQVTTPAIGPIEENDTLTFDYRYVDFFAGTDPTILTAEDSLLVEVSIDCGESFFPAFVITGLNHLPTADMTTIELPLGALAGEIILIRFRAVWGAGDYYLDLDNINIRRCPASLQLSAEVTPPTSQSSEDGSITIAQGDPSGPFTYLWNTGDATKTLSGLGEGLYTVTVTNVYGCSETLEINLTTSSVRTPSKIGEISLAPNPTKGTSWLNVDFIQPVDARIQLLNAVGQLLFESVEQKVSSGAYELDLNQQSSGLYVVRIIAEGEVKAVKLIKAQ